MGSACIQPGDELKGRGGAGLGRELKGRGGAGLQASEEGAAEVRMRNAPLLSTQGLAK